MGLKDMSHMSSQRWSASRLSCSLTQSAGLSICLYRMHSSAKSRTVEFDTISRDFSPSSCVSGRGYKMVPSVCLSPLPFFLAHLCSCMVGSYASPSVVHHLMSTWCTRGAYIRQKWGSPPTNILLWFTREQTHSHIVMWWFTAYIQIKVHNVVLY